jgi:hypothetical protein
MSGSQGGGYKEFSRSLLRVGWQESGDISEVIAASMITEMNEE